VHSVVKDATAIKMIQYGAKAAAFLLKNLTFPSFNYDLEIQVVQVKPVITPLESSSVMEWSEFYNLSTSIFVNNSILSYY